MKQKNIQSKEVRISQILTTIFLFVIILSVMGFIVFGLRRFNLIKFPGFIENLFYFGGSDSNKTPVNDADIYEEILKKYAENSAVRETDDSVIVTAEITGENLTSLLSSLEIPEYLYAETETVHYTDGASRKTGAVLRKNGKKLRLESSEECLIIDTENGEEHYRNYAVGGNVTYKSDFNWRSTPNVYLAGDYFNLAIPDVVIEELKVERGEEENILSFTCLNAALNQREEYKISLDSGMVKSITSYFGDKIYYEYKASMILYANDEKDSAVLPLTKDELFNIKS